LRLTTVRHLPTAGPLVCAGASAFRAPALRVFLGRRGPQFEQRVGFDVLGVEFRIIMEAAESLIGAAPEGASCL
jgi:hypothetical protein